MRTQSHQYCCTSIRAAFVAGHIRPDKYANILTTKETVKKKIIILDLKEISPLILRFQARRFVLLAVVT